MNKQQSVDEYLQNVNPPQKAELERVRTIVKRAVPDAEEVISYGMPGFKYKGKYLMGYAPFKNHMSIFPASNPIATMKDKLKDFKLSKGTVQFTLSHTIPEQLIHELLAVRIADIDGSKAKS